MLLPFSGMYFWWNSCKSAIRSKITQRPDAAFIAALMRVSLSLSKFTRLGEQTDFDVEDVGNWLTNVQTGLLTAIIVI